MYLWNNHLSHFYVPNLGRKILHFLYLFAVLVLLVSCGEPEPETPIEINWGKDICTHCRMIIKDQHFGAQVRGGQENKVYLFNELGSAMLWLEKQPWGNDETTKIWVIDYNTGYWLDARFANYLPEQPTPMNYGFSAIKSPIKGSVNFETAKRRLLAKKLGRQQ